MSRREATSQESRQILLRAAAELFAENGYRATTFEHIAERSGISRGSIPWHFGNKEGLLKAVIDDIRTTGIGAAGAVTSFEDALDQLFEHIRQPTSRLAITLLAEAIEPDSPLTAVCADLQATLRKWLADSLGGVTLPSGMNEDTFITVVHGSIIGVHQQWRVAPEAIDLDTACAAIKTLFVASTKPRRKQSERS
ncbi:TetR/AcrR family transcriptional regulator [Nocardia sp. bgisy134]|uniref:TetR/AcrR family transcriptional regulator n=1 Tax=unclassified Nocardia TaxID=2637762 RepID=UPI003D723767